MPEEAVTELMPVPNSIGARLRALKQEKGELIKEARDIGTKIAVEARGWSIEESALEEKISNRVETLNTEIARFERLIDVDRRAIVDAPSRRPERIAWDDQVVRRVPAGGRVRQQPGHRAQRPGRQ
jgi:cytidylate kinase